MKKIILLTLVMTLIFSSNVFSKENLTDLSAKYSEQYLESRGPLFQKIKARSSGPMARLDALESVEFLGIDRQGWPIMMSMTSLGSAQTLKTDELWPGGESGYDISGSTTLSSQLGIWDGGVVLDTHQEFGNRVVVIEQDGTVGNHPTHVAGTMIASGFLPEAHGMSPAALLSSYDWNDDESELAIAAENGMLATNHSYVYVTGWLYGYEEPEWYWFGDPSVAEEEDYLWGFYSDRSHDLDELAYNAPDMLMCWAAGNDRGLGPQPGREHYVWDPDSSEWVLTETERQRDGGNSGFDCISHSGIAKNVITVGAVEKLTEEYVNPWDVIMSTFSGWGPADDGRIKPDLVAPGVQITSSVATGDDQYATWNGTSMATPSLSGTLSLLQEQYRTTHDGENALAATMKAVMIHTAEECGGTTGPDYRFGWGLVNAHRAADVIADDGAGTIRIFNENFSEGNYVGFSFTADGDTPVKATLVWTDPAGEVIEAALDSIHPALINDLDLRIIDEDNTVTYYPFTLDPLSPFSAAATGDNTVDNVEVVLAGDISEGTNILVQVTYKGTLVDGDQEFSLVTTGMTYNGVSVDEPILGSSLPIEFAISEAYPNPFNPSTTLTISLPENGLTGISVYDINGRQVYSEKRNMAQGSNQFVFDSGKIKGGLASGIYFVSAEFKGQRVTRKITLMK